MIYRSPHPDIVIPDVGVAEFVLRNTERLASKPAMIEAASGRTLTYAELGQQVRDVAAGLAARGFHKGDVLAVYSSNNPEFAIALLAVAMLGGITTTINPLYTADELARQLRDSSARFLVTVSAFLDKASEATSQSKVEEVFVFDKAEGGTPFTTLMRTQASPPVVEIDPAMDVVVLPYSSGTTGLPKGVMLTHRNLVANMLQSIHMECCEGITEPDVVLALVPFFHIYGMTVVLTTSLFQGATIVTMARFDMEDLLANIQKYRISLAPLVPPILLGLAKQPVVDHYDLSSIRIIMSGAAPLSEKIANEVTARVGGKIAQGYGMTEVSPVAILAPTRYLDYKVAALGMPVPNTEAKVVDPATGQSVNAGERGEICLRGPQLMKGYLNRPDATAQSIDADGWYHTGDIGFVDADGYFHVVDRIKELIKYKGMQVAPAELEAVLVSNPAIADAAVIPIPDEEAGELPKAYVVLKPDHRLDADRVMEFVAERVAPHKRIRRVEFVNQIPKSASGKILRRVLIDRERVRTTH